MPRRSPSAAPVAIGISSGPCAAPEHAARAAQCLQLLGATAAGVFTDEEWLLDSAGAVALVFGGPLRLVAPGGQRDATVLSLCTPAGLNARWLDEPVTRLGAVSSDLFGEGPFCVWQAARLSESGRVEAAIAASRGSVEVAPGVRALTAPIEVVEVRGLDVLRLGRDPALGTLLGALPPGARPAAAGMESARLPLHLLLGGVTVGDPEGAIREGRFRLNHIVSTDPASQSVTLAQPLARGERLFWAMRDTLAAERDMQRALERAGARLAQEPDFALLFSCVGRGPHFFGNRDRDLELLQARHPGLPTIGCYGNGEIAPLDAANHLYQHSAALGLFGIGA